MYKTNGPLIVSPNLIKYSIIVLLKAGEICQTKKKHQTNKRKTIR